MVTIKRKPIRSSSEGLLLALCVAGSTAWAQGLPFTPERPGEERRREFPEAPLKKPAPLPQLVPPPAPLPEERPYPRSLRYL